MTQQSQQQYLTRTRQDLINSGDLFRMDEKFAQEERERNRQMIASRKTSNQATTSTSTAAASECCYSICNLALIIASVISLFILIRFIQDEPLYEYGEYLLGLSFYRQLIYLLCLVPFILLLPIWNAMSVLVFALGHSGGGDGGKTGPSGGLLKLRLVYQFLLFALALLGLVFMAPYISRTSVASQIEFEFRRMLKMRFESDFHYQLLDRIQETYECCDNLWYRANLRDDVPVSCYKPGTNFSLIYDDTCPDVLGSLVSTRCAILAACLFAMLVSLACLFAIDCERLLSNAGGGGAGKTRGAYEIAPESGAPDLGAKNARDSNALARTCDPIRANGHTPLAEGDRDSVSSGRRELEEEEEEAERELPLLNASRSPNLNDWVRDVEDEEEQPQEETKSTQSRRSRFLQERDQQRQDSPIVLTRADYKTIVRQRSQSPVFLSPAAPSSSSSATTSGQKPVIPIKSALKSGASQQNVSNEETGEQYNRPLGTYRPRDSGGGAVHDHDHDHDHDEDDDDDSLISDYAERLRKSDSLLRQKQLQRRDQLRKSLQSVRFADDNNP